MVLPRHPVRGSKLPGGGGRIRRLRVPAALLVAFLLALLLCPAGAVALEKWVAAKRFEITGAEGVSFDQPSDLAVGDERIWVLDGVNNRICWFDEAGRPLGAVRGTADIPLQGALGLAIDDRGRILAADGRRGRILAFTGGRLSLLASLKQGEKEKPPEPGGLLHFNNRIYVADNDNHTVRVLGDKGAEEFRWGVTGDGPGFFKYPFRLATDPQGRIGVTDVLNGRVQLFTPRGEHLGDIGRPGTVSGTLFRPGGLDFDEQGNVVVADNFFGTVQMFGPDGAVRAVLHGPEGGLIVLRNPTALKCRKGLLYVVEMGADRVSVFTLEGAGAK